MLRTDFDHHGKVKVNCSIILKDQIVGGCKKLSCKSNIYLFVSAANFYMEFLPDEYHYDSITTSLFSCLIVTVEVRDAPPGHYLLKIKSFSLLSENGIDKIESNEFEAAGYKWKMVIYSNGNTYENGSGHISVYLAISETSSLSASWEVNAIFTFFLFNQLRDIIFQCEEKYDVFNLSSIYIWGLAKFLSHDTFKEASNGYKCVVGAEIFVVQRQAIGECLSMVKSNSSFKRELKICNFSNLNENWLSEEFTLLVYPQGIVTSNGCNISIYLNCVDAKDFNQHKNVDAKCSLNLKDQINSGGKNRSCKPKNFYMEFLADYHYNSIANCSWFSNTTPSLGYPNFMPLTQLRDRKKGYLVKDCIVVEVELEVIAFKHRIKSLC
ncbi:hypothetical protein H5410_037952 [Solanum commersonii]|uniref:MATH domain-containing protein n=1 Tax=Solanum commersonii TaxID=4109 RepID=A0A9J5YAY5_SOLCO|nr:hypothetical protein H5410_037952 [Solanum commersonii]